MQFNIVLLLVNIFHSTLTEYRQATLDEYPLITMIRFYYPSVNW